jgi:MraZ protein
VAAGALAGESGVGAGGQAGHDALPLPRFRGGPVMPVDAKSRLTVPHKAKQTLKDFCDGQLVISKNPSGCLNLYPLPIWEQFEEELAARDSAWDDWRRIYIGSATDVAIDSAGRVLIPVELRQWAGLDAGEGKECKARLMGIGHYFELWDNARWEAREQKALAEGRPADAASVRFRPVPWAHTPSREEEA